MVAAGIVIANSWANVASTVTLLAGMVNVYVVPAVTFVVETALPPSVYDTLPAGDNAQPLNFIPVGGL